MESTAGFSSRLSSSVISADRAKKLRIIFASLVAPIGVLLLPAILALLTMNSDPSDMGANPLDDAPIRAAGIIFYGLIPLAYPVISLLMASIGFGLLAIKKLTFGSLAISYFVLSLVPGVLFGIASPFGLIDQLLSFFIFSFLTMICLSLGVICWWFIAQLGHDKLLHRTGR